MTAVYAYCVAAGEVAGDWGAIGIGGARVYAVRHGDVAALVSALPAGAPVPRPTRDALLAHEFVVWAAARERTVLPVAFGTAFRSDADVAVALAALRDAVLDACDALAGQVELGVAASWTGDPAGARPPAAAVARALRDAVEGATDGAVVVAPLAPIGERSLVRAALLVPRAAADRVAESLCRVAEAAAWGAPGTLRLSVSGPWTPYHFARVRMRVEPAPVEPAPVEPAPVEPAPAANAAGSASMAGPLATGA